MDSYFLPLKHFFNQFDLFCEVTKMDQNTIQNTMDRLEEMKKSANVELFNKIDNSLVIYFDTLKVAYKKYVNKLLNEAGTMKDIPKQVNKCQQEAKKDNKYGEKIISIYNLDNAGKQLQISISSFFIDIITFLGKDFDDHFKCEKAAEKLMDEFDSHRVKFEENFGMKDDKHLSKTLSEIYFAYNVLDDYIDLGGKNLIFKNIESSKEVLSKYFKSFDPEDTDKSLSTILQVKKSTYQKGLSIVKGMIGTYYRAMITAMRNAHFEKE